MNAPGQGLNSTVLAGIIAPKVLIAVPQIFTDQKPA
jgi:hypothetical protein